MNRQESTEFAQKYLADMISFFGENVAVEAAIEDDIIRLDVESSELNSLLIGRNADTLRSLQFMVSAALRNKDAEIVRVNVDIADYKKQREEKVAGKARDWIEGVISSGEPYEAQINAADRRIVHRVAGEFPEIETNSEGEGRDRRIVISKIT